MQIQPGVSAALATLTQGQNRAAPTEAGGEKEVSNIVDDEVLEIEAVETEEVPGVLRMLQEGKFNGVAEVRLRIVHADKLAALEAAQTQAAAVDSKDSLIAAFSSTVAEMIEISDAVSAEQADTAILEFESQVTAAVDTLFAADEHDVKTFEASLQAAFQSLIDTLGLEMGAGASEIDAIEVFFTEETANEEPVVGSRDFMAELSDTFFAQLVSIMESTSNVLAMPLLSEPNSNGRAYEKFVAIYNEMQNIDEVVNEPAVIDLDA